MTAIVKLVKGSPEWHAHRKQHRNASETPAVLGVSPWVTPYQLWLQRTGRAEPPANWPMQRGQELEPLARRAYEQLTGLVMEPLVLVDGEYSASLDGITLDGELILEVKCPVKGKDSELWQQVQSGELPEHTFWQVQHQLLVARARLAHVYVFDGRQGVLLEQQPAPDRWAEISKGWDEFMQLVELDTPPLLTGGDTVVRTDDTWREAAKAYRDAKAQADTWATRAEGAKQRLIALASHPSEKGHGVGVTRFWKQGAIDYKKLAERSGLDADQFRGPKREETRVLLV